MNKDIIKKIKGQALLVLVVSFLFFSFTFLQIFAEEESLFVGQKVEEGVASAYFVDGEGLLVLEPQIVFNSHYVSTEPGEVFGTLGHSGELLFIDNKTSYRSVGVTLAPLLDDTGFFELDALWKSEESSYPIYSVNSEDGRLEVIFDSGVLSVYGNHCADGDFAFGSNSYFAFIDDGIEATNIESIDLIMGHNIKRPVNFCRVVVEDVVLKQIIPAEQVAGDYSLGLVMTIMLSNLFAPSNLEASAVEIDETGVNLEWEDDGDPDVLYFIAELRKSGETEWLLAGDTEGYSFWISGLDFGDEYEFRVAGVYPDGQGPYSNIAVGIPGVL